MTCLIFPVNIATETCRMRHKLLYIIDTRFDFSDVRLPFIYHIDPVPVHFFKSSKSIQ